MQTTICYLSYTKRPKHTQSEPKPGAPEMQGQTNTQAKFLSSTLYPMHASVIIVIIPTHQTLSCRRVTDAGK
jgi:hypothetical protein